MVIDDLRRIVGSVADASQFLMVVTDAEVVILWREGFARVRAPGCRPQAPPGSSTRSAAWLGQSGFGQ